jgi:YHS domain-containing protein
MLSFLKSFSHRLEGMIMAPSVEINVDATGLMIRGYDPVAYFKEGRQIPGRLDISVEYGGAKYLFSSTANRDAFNADPEKYVPQYGGYCAFGVSMGKKFDIDPASWRIVDDKLYFNLNPSILEKWSADAKGYINKSEKHWPQIRGKAPSEL